MNSRSSPPSITVNTTTNNSDRSFQARQSTRRRSQSAFHYAPITGTNFTIRHGTGNGPADRVTTNMLMYNSNMPSSYSTPHGTHARRRLGALTGRNGSIDTSRYSSPPDACHDTTSELDV
ncbi:hypothetical protein Slin15195_G098290 [Septoria linicola]|uniref:Uncharacterized protein n=1 Tax=Septoria linicola TaxID=215465 RepID=A0A9Q9AWN1_9PEZI|nr:hypothetical protein Slin14017_G061350 [Septoria linicola]USW56510.1 hypothetical protein Slin15195_G098290 [Septoria linicola]